MSTPSKQGLFQAKQGSSKRSGCIYPYPNVDPLFWKPKALEVFLATHVGHFDRIAYSSFLQSQVKVYPLVPWKLDGILWEISGSKNRPPRKLTWLAGKSTIWRCISYWNWGFSNVMLIFQGVWFRAEPKKVSPHGGDSKGIHPQMSLI